MLPRIKAHSALTLLLLGTFSITGCASKYGTQTTQVKHYSMCYQPVAELRNDENITANSTATGAVGGALIGAILGGLITGKASGALVGAAAGGATGAVGGNIYGKSQEAKRNAAFYNKYASQLSAETASMNRATSAAKIAAKCYEREFQNALKQTRSGHMTKAQLSERYTEIRAGLEETSRILQSTYTNTAQKDQEYRKVMEQEVGGTHNMHIAQKNPAKIKKPEARVVAQSTNTWTSSRKELQETKSDIDQQVANNEAILLAALEG